MTVIAYNKVRRRPKLGLVKASTCLLSLPTKDRLDVDRRAAKTRPDRTYWVSKKKRNPPGSNKVYPCAGCPSRPLPTDPFSPHCTDESFCGKPSLFLHGKKTAKTDLISQIKSNCGRNFQPQREFSDSFWVKLRHFCRFHAGF